MFNSNKCNLIWLFTSVHNYGDAAAKGGEIEAVEQLTCDLLLFDYALKKVAHPPSPQHWEYRRFVVWCKCIASLGNANLLASLAPRSSLQLARTKAFRLAAADLD